jgi:hypothetical protein
MNYAISFEAVHNGVTTAQQEGDAQLAVVFLVQMLK